MKASKIEIEQVNNFLNALVTLIPVKNDAALAKALDIAPPVVSKFRAGVIPFGPGHIIRTHEITGLAIAEIKAQLPSPKKRGAKD